MLKREGENPASMVKAAAFLFSKYMNLTNYVTFLQIVLLPSMGTAIQEGSWKRSWVTHDFLLLL
jgi:hypothetical protein